MPYYPQPVTVKDAGSPVGTQPAINFIEGSNVTLTITNDPTNQEVDVEIAASGGGGGTPALYYDTTGTTPKVSKAGKYLNLVDGNFPEIDLSGDQVVERLIAARCSAESANLAGCIALTYAEFSSNTLTTVDLTGCTALTEATFNDNTLTTVNLTGCTALTYAEFSSNTLTTVDLTGCTALAHADFSENSLTTVDLSGLTALTGAYFNYNSLTTVDLSGLTALIEADFSENSLTTVDLTGCTALAYAYFVNNALTETAVDGVLAHLDSAGLSDGEVDLSGGTNSIPSAAGLTSKSNLEGKGWLVVVNS